MASYTKMDVRAKAILFFDGDAMKAYRWLERPLVMFDNKTPEEIMQTPGGTDAMFNLLGQLEHGIVT